MTPLEMIAEWRRGCSCAPAEQPEECHECTRALIEAIEKNLQADNHCITCGKGLPGVPTLAQAPWFISEGPDGGPYCIDCGLAARGSL